jgi:hypothetical protein
MLVEGNTGNNENGFDQKNGYFGLSDFNVSIS